MSVAEEHWPPPIDPSITDLPFYLLLSFFFFLSSEQTIQLAALLLLLSSLLFSFSISDRPFSCHWINYNLIGANKSKLIDEQIDRQQHQQQQHRWMRTVSITIVQRERRHLQVKLFPGSRNEMKRKEGEVERYCSHSDASLICSIFQSHRERGREQDKERLVDHLTPSSADFQLLLLLVMMIMV